MIDWNQYGVLPTPETLSTYPSILDILKDTVAQEENAQLFKCPLNRETRDYFYDWTRVGHCLMIRDHDLNMPLLMPTSRTPWTFYRGQSHYHDRCLPSLFRYENDRLEKETLRSFLQTAEMICVMWSHPVIQYIKNGCLMHDTLGPLPLTIMYDGLAQHYGIKTCYLDLTNDIWCAAFFASTIYKDGEYSPVVIGEDASFNNRYGVLYRINYTNGSDYDDYTADCIKPIGLQYFNRPGRQCGFVRSMYDIKDLHLLPNLEKIFFRHDEDASNLIFTLSQWGKQYLPDDKFADIVGKICSEDKISEAGLELAHNIYYRHKDFQTFRKEVMAAGFEITQEPNVSFDPQYIKETSDNWFNGGGQERYVNDIIIMPMTSFPIN